MSKSFSTLETLLHQFVQELNIEFEALGQGNAALLHSTKYRQAQLQTQIAAAIEALRASSRPHLSKNVLSIKAQFNEIARLLERNLDRAAAEKDTAQAQLREIGNFNRIHRKFFPKKLQKNTPVLLDIRR